MGERGEGGRGRVGEGRGSGGRERGSGGGENERVDV